MRPFHPFRSGFYLFLISLMLVTLMTGCSWESWSGKSGTGYSIGILLVPTVSMMAAVGVGLISYWMWRRRK